MNNYDRRPGFDAPKYEASQDQLGRIHLAKSIYRLATDIDPTWSLRIGIHGEWGSGKTSLMNFVREMAKTGAHHLIEINAWQYTDPQQLQDDILLEVLGIIPPASRSAAVTTTQLKIQARRVGRILSKSAGLLSAIAGAQAALKDLEKVVEQSSAPVGGALERLRPSKSDLISLNSALSGKRVIVLVDDIDRADPSLLSRLFFNLRETLDIPGLTFLLCFDRERVVPILQSANPGFDTDEFLDKIVEIPVFIPEATLEQRAALCRFEASSHGLSIDPAILNSIVPFISKSPRKLRIFIRSLVLLKSELERHDNDEIDYSLLLSLKILAELLPTLPNDLSLDRDLRHSLITVNWRKTDSLRDLSVPLNNYLNKKDLKINEKNISRIILLLEFMSSSLSAHLPDQLTYHLGLLTSPHPVTHKEFRIFYQATENRHRSAILKWAMSHSDRRETTVAAVLRDLFIATLRHQSSLQESAINVGTLDEQKRHLSDVLSAIQFADAVLSLSLEYVGVFSLQDVLDARATLNNYSNFTTSIFAEVRSAEAALHCKLLDIEQLPPGELLEALTGGQIAFHTRGLDADRAAVDRLIKQLTSDAVNSFSERRGIENLGRKWGKRLTDQVLFSRSSPLWNSPTKKQEVFEVLRKSLENDVVFENSFSVLNKVPGNIDFLEHRDLVIELWKSVTSRRMNRRFFGSLIRDLMPNLEKTFLIDQKPIILPKPEWWAEAVSEHNL